MQCTTHIAPNVWKHTTHTCLYTIPHHQQQDNNNNFGSTNGSSLTHYTDGTEGSAWHFHKDDLDRRCEVKGAAGFTPVAGQTYYIGVNGASRGSMSGTASVMPASISRLRTCVRQKPYAPVSKRDRPVSAPSTRCAC